MNGTPDFSPQVAEQAVHWLMEMQQGALSPRQQTAWQQWLDAHSEHQRAWEHIQRVNQRLRGLSSPLAHAALNAPTSTSRRQALKLLLILGAGSAAAWGLREHISAAAVARRLPQPHWPAAQDALADGSQLQLNTGSAVDVHFDGQQRLIRLLEGEILLTGRRNALRSAHRPRLLKSEGARLNVRQFADHTQLAVFDGRVELPTPDSGLPLRAARRAAGQFHPRRRDTPRPPDANSGAWADGMLVAAHMRLEDFLGELGRYRRGQLNCDPQGGQPADLRQLSAGRQRADS